MLIHIPLYAITFVKSLSVIRRKKLLFSRPFFALALFSHWLVYFLLLCHKRTC